ncbi:hypothetical protein EVAR_98683_1 [Eumeta japonica]|uniref:Uncharacterized protein n=1 Tax=Eumeta variegata TaxID=151549 RepID=A0A4C1XVN1_EUMVA|nr:hypothetical protein EVAR_98683_1 [Eumeta japonica]
MVLMSSPSADAAVPALRETPALPSSSVLSHQLNLLLDPIPRIDLGGGGVNCIPAGSCSMTVRHLQLYAIAVFRPVLLWTFNASRLRVTVQRCMSVELATVTLSRHSSPIRGLGINARQPANF